MEVVFTLTPEDMRVFRGQDNAPFARNMLWTFMIWMGAAGAFLWYITFGARQAWRVSSLPMLIGMGFSALGATLAAVALGIIIRRNHLNNREGVPDGMRDPITVSINAGHMYRTDSTGETFSNWKTLHSIRDLPAHFMVYLYDGSAALIIPKRAFATPEDARSFYETAYAYWKDAQAA